MPRYKLQGPDGRTVTIEAADRATALRGAQEWAAANPAPSQPVTPQQQAALDYTRRIAEVSAMAARRPAPPRTRPNETRRERTQREGEAYASRTTGGDVQLALGSGVLRGLGGMADLGGMLSNPALAFSGQPQPSAILGELGWGYTPQTDAGSLAEGAGMMLPNALAPGSALARTAAVALPTIAGEAARIGTREAGYDEQSQENMRAGGQFLAGLASGFVPSRAGAAARPPATRPAPPRVRSRSDDVRLLRESGVDMTPGDRMGGVPRLLEDAAQSLPILGPAIRGARGRGIVSMNVARVQDALAPIGGRVSRTTPAGGEMVSDAADQIGAHLNAAAARIPSVRPTPSTSANLAAARASLSDDASRAKWDAEVNRYLDQDALARGELSGADIRRAESKLNEAARRRSRSAITDDQEIGDALRLAVNEMKDVLAQSAPPGVAEDLQAGRNAWARMVRVLKASEAAGGDVFSASQYANAVSAAESNRSNIGRARGLGQDFSRAAKRVFGNRLPDSGTADRAAVIGGTATAAGATGMAVAGQPLPLMGVAAGAAALSVPAAAYSMMARNIAARVPKTASAAEARAAARELEALAGRAPPDVAQQILAIRDAMLRAAPVAAIAGSTAASQAQARPSPPR